MLVGKDFTPYPASDSLLREVAFKSLSAIIAFVRRIEESIVVTNEEEETTKAGSSFLQCLRYLNCLCL